ncbi:MAG TPA: hypothetical protein VGE98_09910 [Thermoanaerobaculia bacterium]
MKPHRSAALLAVLTCLAFAAAHAKPAPTATATAAIEVRGADGKPSLALRITGDRVRIELPADGNRVLTGVEKETGKRKYAFAGSGPFAEVKPGDAGFKLRGPDGKLKWKVKLDAGSVKVSDNEEGQRAIVVKVRGAGLEVRRDAAVLGGVDFKAGRDGVVVHDASGRILYRSEGAPSALFGLLLVPEIPSPERAILMAELLARQR